MAAFRFNTGIFNTAGDVLSTFLTFVARYWPLSWKGLSAIVLGALFARWVWILFAPQPIYTSALPERPAAEEAERLFGQAINNKDTSQGVALPNAKLIGVFAASAYKPGFAILKLESGRQVGAGIGEEVAQGVKLVAIKSTHVVLERNGIQQKVNLENQYVPGNGAVMTTIQQSPANSEQARLPAFGAAASTANNNAFPRGVPQFTPPRLPPGVNQPGSIPPGAYPGPQFRGSHPPPDR